MDLGLPELAIILVIVILLWGPGRLSKLGGELGSGIRSFRQGLSDPSKEKEQPESQMSDISTAEPVPVENRNGTGKDTLG